MSWWPRSWLVIGIHSPPHTHGASTEPHTISQAVFDLAAMTAGALAASQAKATLRGKSALVVLHVRQQRGPLGQESYKATILAQYGYHRPTGV